MKRSDVQTAEHNEYLGRYINLVDANVELLDLMHISRQNIIDFFKNEIPTSKLNFRYAENKWSVKEVLQHVIDTERIFMYRSLRAGRLDPTPMQGYDQDLFNSGIDIGNISLTDLLEEYENTRNCYISLMQNMPVKNNSFVSEASGSSISARAAAFLTLGHEKWHMNIIRERYL